MIACKARFRFAYFARLRPVLAVALFFCCFPAAAQDYLIPPIFAFDTPRRDYGVRHLRDNVRFLLFRSEFKVRQTGYASNSGNLTNLQLATDFSQLLSADISGLAPAEIDRDLYNAERFTVRLYESIARRWERLNPIPGLYYSLVIRSPAYPFVFLEGLDSYAFDLGTFPFTDDERFKQTLLWQRQYGFAFRIIFN